MPPHLFSKATLVQHLKQGVASSGGAQILALGLLLAAGSLGAAEAAARVSTHLAQRRAAEAQLASLAAPPAGAAADAPAAITWQGADLDGDGAPDFANPTGGAPRGHDGFGDGFFQASRDGGRRAHEGVDYDSSPGQPVIAPISGYVSKIGFAYPGDTRLRYVEIDNPALKLTARAFYIDPAVHEGESVRLGQQIGTALSLQRRYPGITNHVHLEIAERGRKIDAQSVILARRDDGAGLMAAMN
jgi:murein DD-endopeptidase MepM/ murein hydrolase activator NlpD